MRAWASPRSFSICCRSATASLSSLRASLDLLSAWYSGLCPISRPRSFPFSSNIVSPVSPMAGLRAPREDEALAAGKIEQHLDSIVSPIHRDRLGDAAGAAGIDLQRQHATR